jgi:hypothetical protein
MLTKLDFNGMPIKAPCTIVYPVRKGSKLGMRRMNVERITADRIIGFNPDGRRVSIQNWENCVVVYRGHDSREDDLFDV